MRDEKRWWKSRGTCSPSPSNTTTTKKHIYRINYSYRTATNHWQMNLNSNNGKNFVTLLGKTREKGEWEKVNPSWTGTSERELQRSKGSCTLESHLLDGKINQTRGIPRCREECSSKSEFWKADRELNRSSELWTQSPKIETPEWGMGT